MDAANRFRERRLAPTSLSKTNEHRSQPNSVAHALYLPCPNHTGLPILSVHLVSRRRRGIRIEFRARRINDLIRNHPDDAVRSPLFQIKCLTRGETQEGQSLRTYR